MRSVRASRDPVPLFSDIDSHWAKDCIAELAQQQLVKGSANGQFRPDASMTRVEFAALMYWVFPRSLPVRQPQPFDDILQSHWAHKIVEWVSARGLFSGYRDRTFRPNQPVSRTEALMVLVKGLNYVLPWFPEEILRDYFDDAVEVPSYAQSAIATATLSGLVVSYPNVRQLRPNQTVTRGEVAAMLCQVLNPAPRRYTTWSTELAAVQAAVPFELLKGNARLVKQMQTRLRALRLYPPTAAIDGKYGPPTEAALIDFCRVLELPNQRSYLLDPTLANLLLNLEPVCFILERARDRDKVFAEYLQQEAGFGAARLAFLDKGIQGSPYEAEIQNYPAYLLQKTNAPIAVPVTDRPSAFSLFPKRGVVPAIDSDRLSFLHEDIAQACVCLGSFIDGQLQARWLGKAALTNVELWSATKIIPLLNVVSKVNASFSAVDVDDGLIRPRGSRGYRFYDLALDIVNYKSAIGSSNSLAAMFKQFETPQNLENWIKGITGNDSLVFRGRYGEGVFMQSPELWDQRLQKVVLRAIAANHRGDNTISTYDMTRLIAMLAWHPHLPIDAQFPGAQWHSLESLIRAMGADSARYLDVAIDRLGLTDAIESPVIISKLGFGRSGIRNRTELVYCAFVQFRDRHSCSSAGASMPRWRSIAMTLIGAKKLGNGDQEAIELDARMAAEVTEVLRRVVMDELV